MDQSISDNPLGPVNDGDVEGQNNSEKPTPSPGKGLKSEKHKEKNIFEKLIDFQTTEMKFRTLRFATEVRLGCVALLWLVLSLYVPSMKRMTLFGTLLWKWSLFAVDVLLLNLCTFLLTLLITTGTCCFLNYRRRKQGPFFALGLLMSFSKLLYYGLLLTQWLVYFHKDHGLNPNPSIDKYGTWTLVSLLLWAALGVLKRAVLLHWQANAILERLKDRVLSAGFHLFYISLILKGVEQPPLTRFGPQKSFKEFIGVDVHGNKSKGKDATGVDVHVKEKMRKDATLNQVMDIVKRLRNLAELTRREDNTTAKIIEDCEKNIPSDPSFWEEIKRGSLDSFARTFKMCDPGANHFLTEVKAMHDDEEITYEMIQKWTMDAHNNCLSVAYTLEDAFAVVKILNLVLSSVIVVVVILFWLMTTELAKTNALITIGTVFLSLSFMFSDTCKAFLNGVIFSFVTHPFDIGDRCIIDGNEVEVKRISILTTTFTRIGSEESMLYPNTDISNRLIINLGSKPDPTDLIEIVLDPSTKSNQIESVRKSIEEFIGVGSKKESYNRVIVKVTRTNIIMSIRFKHNLNAEDTTHSGCFDKKNRQRYEYFMKIKKLLEDQHIEFQTLPYINIPPASK